MTEKARFVAYNDLKRTLQDHEANLPSLQSGELLVRILFTTLCRSDIHTYLGRRQEKSPTILGHEIVGEIIAYGPDAPLHDLRGYPLKIGDRITWGIYASDPDDKMSKMGMPQKAINLFKYGHEELTEESQFHGGLAEYIILRKHTSVVIIHDDIPDRIAALINCSVATVAGAIRLAGSLKGKNVLVFGTGMLGTIACAMAKKNSALKVIAADKELNRSMKALQFGADDFIALPQDQAEDLSIIGSELSVLNDIDIVLEFTGIPEAIMFALSKLNVGGKAILVGSTFRQPDISINAEMIVRKLLTIQGLHNYNEKDLVSAVAFMESARHFFPFEELVSKTFDLSQVQQAFEYAVQHNPYRVGIDMKLDKK
jgi:putative phosphonate catabolism associated alcohol dehydrogenase